MMDISFKELEHEGWSRRADAYDAWFATITRQAIEPVCTALGPFYGKSVLDVCCGTGDAAAAFADAGAAATGVDFSEAMVEWARVNHPHIAFRTADAEALPFDDGAFGAVHCGFGLLHLSDPDQAIAEARRVLRPGGRYAATIWCGPANGGVFHEIVLGSIAEHGTFDVGLPPAPDMFRFDDETECRNAFAAGGFADVTTHNLDLLWHPSEPQSVIDMVEKSVVRGPMILERQTPDALGAIHDAMRAKAETRRGTDGRITIPMPALMVVGTA